MGPQFANRLADVLNESVIGETGCDGRGGRCTKGKIQWQIELRLVQCGYELWLGASALAWFIILQITSDPRQPDVSRRRERNVDPLIVVQVAQPANPWQSNAWIYHWICTQENSPYTWHPTAKPPKNQMPYCPRSVDLDGIIVWFTSIGYWILLCSSLGIPWLNWTPKEVKAVHDFRRLDDSSLEFVKTRVHQVYISRFLNITR